MPSLQALRAPSPPIRHCRTGQLPSNFSGGIRSTLHRRGGGFRGFDQVIPEFPCAPRQVGQDAALVPAFVVFLALIDILRAVFEHVVNETRQFPGGRRDRFGRAETALQAPEERAECLLAVMQAARGQPQHGRRAVGGCFGAAVQHLAARDLVAG